MKIRSLLVDLGLVLVWVASMLWVYSRNYASSGSAQLAAMPRAADFLPATEHWYDVTISGQKIGYAMNSVQGSPLGFIFKDYSFLRLPMGGAMREILMDFYAVVDTDFAVKTFTFGLSSDEYMTNVYGQLKDAHLELTIGTDSNATSLRLPAKDKLYLPGVLPYLLASKGFPVGRFTLTSLDPVSLITIEMLVDVVPGETLRVAGKSYPGYLVKTTTAGVTTQSLVTNEGLVVKEEETGGMMMQLTSREQALDVPERVNDWDLLRTLAVPCQGVIAEPRQTTFLQVELKGIEPAVFELDDDFQRVVSSSPLVVEIKPEGFGSSRVPSQKYISPEPLIQSDSPRLALQAKQVVGNLTDRRLQVKALVEWVYANVEKDYTFSVPSALEVLRAKKGDCNEHTALFTAMARSLGIPTKICLGVVYKDRLFYYHAWPAVYLGDRWVPVDPTFGQLLADACHIKLLDGSQGSLVGLMRAVGKLSVEIRAWQPQVEATRGNDQVN